MSLENVQLTVKITNFTYVIQYFFYIYEKFQEILHIFLGYLLILK